MSLREDVRNHPITGEPTLAAMDMAADDADLSAIYNSLIEWHTFWLDEDIYPDDIAAEEREALQRLRKLATQKTIGRDDMGFVVKMLLHHVISDFAHAADHPHIPE